VALNGAGLEVPAGMVFGLLGPNGAGKATLVRILATLLAPDAGRVEVFGHDVAGEPAAVRELIGLTGQFAAVDELLTGRENLEMFGRLFKPPEQAHSRAGELLERFELAEAGDRPARTYSGGMRRRLDIASSLLTRPQVLFLDEPTTGLDPRSRSEIWAIVRELRREGTTLLLTTQYLEEADQLADRIAVIDRGKVIAEGTGNELKDRVGGQILEVELSSAGQRDRAQAVLAGVGCGEPEPDERPDRLTLPAPRNGLVLVEEAAAELRRAQIGVSDIGMRRPTLDDVFLQLTGAPPSEDGGAPSPRTRRRPRPQQPQPDVPAPRRPVLRLRSPSPRAVRSALTHTAVVTGRNLRHFIRQPDLLTFSTIQPVIFVLLFVYVFGGAVGRSLPHGVAYVDFLLPGIFVQSVTFRASQTAVGLSEDLERGVVDRFRSMPMARSAVLAGRTVADLVRNIAIIGLMIVVGYLVGFRFHGGVAGRLRASPSSPPSASPSAGSSRSWRLPSAAPRRRRRPGSS
jgi:daunorubicin resistance ABC transporter ATP-binding subunit